MHATSPFHDQHRKLHTTADVDAYIECGEGSPILLLHGVGLRAECWAHQINALAHYRHVYALDLAGHGQSSRLTVTTATLDDYATRIANFIDQVIGQATVCVGHSLGALICLKLAADYSQHVRALAAFNPIAKRTEAAQRAVQQRAADLTAHQPNKLAPDSSLTRTSNHSVTLERWFGAQPNDIDTLSAQACADWLNTTDHVGYSTAYSVFANENGPDEHALKSMRQPALLVTAANDPNSTPAMCQYLSDQLAFGQMKVVADSRHMMTMTHADQVNVILKHWLSDLEENA